ncbi:MAG: type II secretion system F family protein [Verrucomicrobia bacterium]|nr:type II secretion system F family protein [Verrucomicrobiota bacterium]
MPHFNYSARDRAGKRVTDALEAPTRKDALRLLAARGLQVIAVHEAGAGAAPAAAPAAAAGRNRVVTVTRKHRLPFLEALRDLLTSGLSAGEAVRLLSIRIKEPGLHTLCVGLWERLSEGAPLSRAMADFPEVFDPSTVSLIQAGEATGSLTDTLERLISYLHEQRELRTQLLTALAYPALLITVAGGLVLFFLFFLLPRLQTLFKSLHGEMPLSTRLLVAGANFTVHYGLLVLAAAVLGLVSFWRWRQTESGRATSDAWLLRLPLVGPFVVSQTVLAISQTLSVLLANGITAVEALRMTERQLENRVHRRAFHEATDRVIEGESLSSALTRTGCFPDLVLDRLTVGENTGNVVPSLREIARTYRRAISGQLNMFVNVLATGVLIGVFIIVGFIAFAIVSAVFQVSSSFRMS